MGKLKLEFQETWQKPFELSELNILLIFQVNCPGCFMHAFPLAKKILSQYGADLNFVAMSTAFEDFDLNTAENTELLVRKRSLVGETKKANDVYQFYDANLPGDYPILMDKLVTAEEFLKPGLISKICNVNPDYKFMSVNDKESLQRRVMDYYRGSELVAETFHLNQFRGTPTFVIFNKEYDILGSWFGHKPSKEIETLIDKWI